MVTPILQVDAFADEAFKGNPAGVCILSEERSSEWMQMVAAEMNLSETAFLLRAQDGWSLRWFTPVTEVKLCGHATLASAHVLWEEDYLHSREQARFQTASGLLTAVRTARGIEMDFPVQPLKNTDPVPGMAKALGSSFARMIDAGPSWLVELEDPFALRTLAPDFGALARIPRGRVIVTSASDNPSYDFLSRFFGPSVGVNEDPVTGSAHCALAPFWQERLGKDEMRAYQASARGGVVGVRMVGDRVMLIGKAATVIRGEIVA